MGTDLTEHHMAGDTNANSPAGSRLRLAWGKASLDLDAEITPTGFLAIGGMVGLILVAVVPIVLAGGRARR